MQPEFCNVIPTTLVHSGGVGCSIWDLQTAPYYSAKIVIFWHERWRCSQALFRWLTGYDVSGHYFSYYFFLFFPISCVVYFPQRRSAQIKSRQEQTQTGILFWGPPLAILHFAGGVVLQTVWCYRP